ARGGLQGAAVKSDPAARGTELGVGGNGKRAGVDDKVSAVGTVASEDERAGAALYEGIVNTAAVGERGAGIGLQRSAGEEEAAIGVEGKRAGRFERAAR